MKIILGSASKGRQDVLKRMGYDFEVMSADIDEKLIRNENPVDLVLSIAQAKTKALLPKIIEPAILITSDQVILFNGEIREKPLDEKQAYEFLATSHLYPVETVGAVVVTNTKTGKTVDGLQRGRVYFKPISGDVISLHIKSGGALRGAGGFIIDDPIFIPFIDRIEGSMDSVIGLDSELTGKLIQEVL
jgi:septum formation protein